MYIVESILPEIEPAETFKSLGYSKKDKPPSAVQEIIESTLERILNNTRLLAGYDIICDFEVEPKRLHTKHASIESTHMAKIANSAQEMLIALFTLKELEDAKENNIAQEFIEHGLKAYALERAQQRMMQEIARQKNKYVSLPFSPGYCDWELTGQELIMQHLDPEALGVHIHSQTYSMLPVYSISCVSFLGYEKMENNPCKYCNIKNTCNQSRYLS